MMSTAAVRPPHELSHTDATSAAGVPPASRHAAPLVAMTSTPAAPARRNTARSRRPGSAGLNRNRCIAAAASAAPAVAPAETPASTHSGTPPVQSIAPANTPGQYRSPSRNSRATDTPAGGQTNVWLPSADTNSSASWALK
jgi:hypothetical protein